MLFFERVDTARYRRTANLLLVPDLQSAVVDAMPHAFSPVPGGWGRMGFTTVDLAKVTEAELVPVLRESHALASEPARRGPKVTSSKAKTSATKAKTSTKTKSSPTKAKPSSIKAKPSSTKKTSPRGGGAR
jgi:hypothetical protein